MLRKEIMHQATEYLTKAGVPNSALDVRVLCGHAWGLPHEQMILRRDDVLTISEINLARAAFRQRAKRVPLAYIVGEKEFWRDSFVVTDAVLVPRPETELIVETATRLHNVGLLPASPSRLCDLGTGSGCIAISLLRELPNMTALAVDQSISSACIALHNVIKNDLNHRCDVVCCNWADAISEQFALVVANPPYIPTDELASLQPEVATCEPVAALDGGSDGLDAYRKVCPAASYLLADEGILLLEIGEHQRQPVQDIARNCGLVSLSCNEANIPHGVAKDLAGRERVVALIKR